MYVCMLGPPKVRNCNFPLLQEDLCFLSFGVAFLFMISSSGFKPLQFSVDGRIQVHTLDLMVIGDYDKS